MAAGAEPEPVRGHARRRRATTDRSAGRTRARCSSSASTSTRRRPARRSRDPTRSSPTPTARPSRSTSRSTDFCGELMMFKTSPRRSDPTSRTRTGRRRSTVRHDRSRHAPTSRRCARASTRPTTLPARRVRLEHRRDRRLEAPCTESRTPAAGSASRRVDVVASRRVDRRVAALDRPLVGAEVRRDDHAGRCAPRSGVPSAMTWPASRQ